MSVRFIVAVEPLAKDQERLFKDFIEENGGRWWHWISNFWLIRFRNDETARNEQEIWQFLINLNPSARIFISIVKETDWTVTKVEKGSRDMSNWLERNWMDD